MNSTHTAATAEEGVRARKANDYDFRYVPEIDTHTPPVVALQSGEVGRVLKAQAGIQGILAVLVGSECAAERGDEVISGPTRGELLMAVEALAEFSYDELTRAVRRAEAAVPRH